MFNVFLFVGKSECLFLEFYEDKRNNKGKYSSFSSSYRVKIQIKDCIRHYIHAVFRTAFDNIRVFDRPINQN